MKELIGKKIFFALSATKSIVDQWQYFHFIDEFKHYNIDFEIFNIYDYSMQEYENILINKIKILKNDISLFITAYQDHQISIKTIQTIKNLGIPTLLICYDNLSIPYAHKKICIHFDLVWLTSFETEHLFKKWGANTIFMPYAANPFFFSPTFSQEIPCVGFIGTLYGARSYKIKLLSDHNIMTQVYTQSNNDSITIEKKQGWDDKLEIFKKFIFKNYHLFIFKEGRNLLVGDLVKAFKKRIEKKINFQDTIHLYKHSSFEDMNKLYSDFALSLGITEVWNTYLLKRSLHKLHLRTFEIPMCGGLQIAYRIPELMNYFEDGKEIILYDSDEEMVSKIKFYLDDKNSGLRKTMKLAARKRAENEHTWHNRFSKIVPLLFK